MMTLNLPVKLVDLRLRDNFNWYLSRFFRKTVKDWVFGAIISIQRLVVLRETTRQRGSKSRCSKKMFFRFDRLWKLALIFFISTNVHKSVRKIISFPNFTVMTRANDIIIFLTVSTYPEYRPIAADAGMLTVKWPNFSSPVTMALQLSSFKSPSISASNLILARKSQEIKFRADNESSSERN